MKKYPFEKQEEIKDCGAACLSMIIKYHNGYIPLDDLREMTKTNKDGTTAYHLTQALDNIGFESYGVECPLDEFRKEDIMLPCIASVSISNYKHFIVIYRVNYKRNYLIIGDPQDSVKRISFKAFNNIYNNVLIISKPYKTIPIINNCNYKFIYSILVKNKILLFKLIFLSIILTLLSILSSLYLEFIIKGINIRSEKLLYNILIVFFSTFLLKSLVSFIRNKVLIDINHKIDYDLTKTVFQKIIMLPYHYYRNRSTGDIISRINDLAIVRDMISKVALTLFIDLPLTMVVFIVLYLLNHVLFIVTSIIIIFYFITVIVFKNIYQVSIRRIQNQKAETTSFMIESISGFETLKGLHIEKNMICKFKEKYYRLINQIKKYQFYYFIHVFLKDLINDIGFVVMFFIGGLLVINKQYTLGSLLTYSILFNLFIEPLKAILAMDNEIKEAKSSLKRINEIIIKDNSSNGLIEKELCGDIRFNKLKFTFNDRDMILKDIDLNISHKSKVMVIGKSGSGKSTLFKLLMKYYDVGKGQVIIDDIDINNISKNSIEQDIVYINQNEILFNDTIYNNINITGSKQDEFVKVTKMCHVDSIFNDQGYNMMIEENGFNLSGGERQRIILARSLLKRFNILIIDEGLNQIDINLERKILKNMFKTYTDKTIIVISHRLDNMDLFDQLIEIDNGTIIRNDRKGN